MWKRNVADRASSVRAGPCALRVSLGTNHGSALTLARLSCGVPNRLSRDGRGGSEHPRRSDSYGSVSIRFMPANGINRSPLLRNRTTLEHRYLAPPPIGEAEPSRIVGTKVFPYTQRIVLPRKRSTCGSGGTADALASGASPSNRVGVQIPASAPTTKSLLNSRFRRDCGGHRRRHIGAPCLNRPPNVLL